MRGILLVCALSAAAPAETPDIELVVLLPRTDLRPGEQLTCHVLVRNKSATPLTAMSLEVTKPAFMEGEFLDFEPVPAHGFREQKVTWTIDDEITEGTHAVSFLVRYSWSGGSGFLHAEKSLDIGLFGSETAGGFSLRLVSLFVPGLVFFLVAGLFSVPRIGEIGSLEKGGLAVLISLMLAGITNPKASLWTTSLPRLGLLTAMTALCGLAVGIIWKVKVACDARQRKAAADAAHAARVRQSDDPIEVLRKHLEGGGTPERQATRVKLADGTTRTGAVLVPAEEGHWLLGWYQMRAPTAKDFEKWTRLVAAKDWKGLFQLARSSIVNANPILKEGGQLTASESLYLADDQVRDATKSTEPLPLLEIKAP